MHERSFGDADDLPMEGVVDRVLRERGVVEGYDEAAEAAALVASLPPGTHYREDPEAGGLVVRNAPALPDRETLRAWLIRTTKHPSGTKALWWGPDECGYTTDLDAAGLYTAEDLGRILVRSPLSKAYLAAKVRSLRVPGQASVEAEALDHPALPLPVVRTCGACGWYTVPDVADAVNHHLAELDRLAAENTTLLARAEALAEERDAWQREYGELADVVADSAYDGCSHTHESLVGDAKKIIASRDAALAVLATVVDAVREREAAVTEYEYLTEEGGDETGTDAQVQAAGARMQDAIVTEVRALHAASAPAETGERLLREAEERGVVAGVLAAAVHVAATEHDEIHKPDARAMARWLAGMLRTLADTTVWRGGRSPIFGEGSAAHALQAAREEGAVAMREAAAKMLRAESRCFGGTLASSGLDYLAAAEKVIALDPEAITRAARGAR